MGVNNSKLKALEDQNSRLSCDIENLRDKLEESENAAKKITEEREEIQRKLDEFRDRWSRMEENLRKREAEVESGREEGFEPSQIVALKKQIAEDRQRIMEEKEQRDKELEAALRQQGQLLENMSKEYASDKKKMIDAQNDLKKNQLEMIQHQKTFPAKQSIRKLINIFKSTLRSMKLHATNPSKWIQDMEINQRDLDRCITDVKSYMDEGYVTIEALSAYTDAALLNTKMLLCLEMHGKANSDAVAVAIEAYEEEWQELMVKHTNVYSLTDQNAAEIRNIFYNRFRDANLPSIRGMTSSASLAADTDPSTIIHQSSTEMGFEVSSTPFASGGGERGPYQMGYELQSLTRELYQRTVALTTVVEKGLESGRFDKEGTETKDQD